MNVSPPFPDSLLAALRADGHCRVHAAPMLALLAQHGSLADWPAFAASWAQMPVDAYMADGGRYRRRRHAVFAAFADGRIEGLPHQPHFQSRDYNALNGGIERWFEPIEAAVANSASLHAVLRFCHAVFGQLRPEVPRWKIEVHQFRIEARSDAQGLPTPEGVHRDGVDHVLVLLVRRHNIASGTTTIHAPDGRDLGSFTLTEPGDSVLIDDHRVFHGVTPVRPLDPQQAAYRDVLVVTFRREQG